MRVAIIPGFATEGTEGEQPSSLSGWAEDEKFRSQLAFVPAHLTAADGIARMLNLGSGQQTFVVQLRGYEMLTKEQAELLDAGFGVAERDVNDEIERWLSEARQLALDPLPESREAARSRYRKVTRALRNELSPRRALALMELADLERRSGNTKEAKALLDHAISISPRQAALLERRATLARETGESAVAVAMMQRLLHEVEASDDQRAKLSQTLARESLAAARQALELALELRPGDRAVLEQLRAVHEASGLWDLAVGTRVELAEGIDDRRQRAQALVAAAHACSEQTGNIPRAVALYEAAIEDDPQVPGAFDAVEAELQRVGDKRGLASAYDRQVDARAARRHGRRRRRRDSARAGARFDAAGGGVRTAGACAGF
jgi:tetratricopeptide (TPR) repeat protein